MLAIVVSLLSNATLISAWAQSSDPGSGASIEPAKIDRVVTWEYSVKTFQVPGLDKNSGKFIRQSLNENWWALCMMVGME